MKQLRILTGIHAGATAPLAPGVYRIAADDEADIRITDWTGAAALVEVSDSDLVTVRLLPVAGAPAEHAATAADADAHETHDRQAPHDARGAEADNGAASQHDDAQQPGASAAGSDAAAGTADTAPVFMLDFLPMQFDQSVLCIGPDDTEWPSDLQLLSTLLKPGQPDEEAVPVRQRSPHRTFIALGLACVVLLLVTCAAVLSMAPRAKASLVPQDVAAMENLNREFANAHLGELQAVLDGHGGVIVHGLVTDESDNLAARRLIAGVTAPQVQPQYGIAEVIRRSIGESLPIDGISVHYNGAGVFSIAGSNVDMDALQQGVRRIRHDLPASVRDIRIDATGVEQPDMPASSGYVAMVSSDTVRYAQTPDGVKHIFILDDGSGDDAASAASAVGAASAATAASAAGAINATDAAGATGATSAAPVVGAAIAVAAPASAVTPASASAAAPRAASAGGIATPGPSTTAPLGPATATRAAVRAALSQPQPSVAQTDATLRR